MNTLPDTSISAFRSLTPEKLAKDYRDILFALKSLRLANYEAIASFLGWPDIVKCARRLSEMERAQLIYKPGSKSLTKRNRQAYDYSAVENGEVSAQPEKVMPGESVSDLSRKLVQKNLFE